MGALRNSSVKTYPWSVSARTQAGGRPGQAVVSSAYMWVRSGGRLGWTSLQHPLAHVKVRMGCRPGQIRVQHLPVHIKVRTGSWLDWARLQHPQA